MRDLYIIPECFVDTSLVESLLTTDGVNHQKGCFTVAGVMDSKLGDETPRPQPLRHLRKACHGRIHPKPGRRSRYQGSGLWIPCRPEGLHAYHQVHHHQDRRALQAPLP